MVARGKNRRLHHAHAKECDSLVVYILFTTLTKLVSRLTIGHRVKLCQRLLCLSTP